MVRVGWLEFALLASLMGMGDTSAAEGDKVVYGAGMITCGEWQKYRSSGDKPNSYQAQAWIDGYLSGTNGAGSGPDFLAPKPSDVAYYAWIDNYCAQNPLDRLIRAVWLLKKELVARAPSR